MPKPETAPALVLLEALADADETPLLTLRRILRERDDLLRKLAAGPSVQIAPEGPSYEPQQAREGLMKCDKHGRSFRAPRGCGECEADEASDAAHAARIGATVTRTGATS
jgi:hypothetical protein